MDREEYIDYLKSQNGECGCPNLQRLYSISRKLTGIVIQADNMKNGVDLDNPREEDLDYIMGYRQKVADVRIEYNNYLKELTRKINDETLELILHAAMNDNFDTVEKIKIHKSRLNYLTDLGEIIGAYCGGCETQVDIVSD